MEYTFSLPNLIQFSITTNMESTLPTPQFFTYSNLEIKWIDGSNYSIMKLNLKDNSKKYDWFEKKSGIWIQHRKSPYGIKIEGNTIIIDGAKKKKYGGFDKTNYKNNGDGSITIKGDVGVIKFENISQYYTFMGWIKE